MIIRPTVIYGTETWTLTSKIEKMLMTWERIMLTNIYGPTKENGQWRIKTNAEFITKYKSQDTVTVI
jgi:DNA-directed RNA polymerase subunit L